jgi:SNF2 family DNA or RNA helicase
MRFARAGERRPPARGALHAELTEDGRRIVLMGAGNDWDQSLIATHIGRLTALHSDAVIDGRPTGAVTIPCTWANFVQLSNSFNQATGLSFAPRERLIAWAAGEYARRVAEPPELEVSWPPWLAPRDYQVEAARMLAQAGKFFLLDDMGLGKTLTTILGIEQRRRMGITVFPMVILVPSWEVADAWVSEIGKWMPSWHEPVLHAGPGRNDGRDVRAFRSLPGSAGIPLITTYATARKDAADVNGPLARLRPATVVIDEASLIQNANARQSQAAERIARHAATVVELSGTFITRDAGGAFPGLKAADPGTWQSKERYVARFCLTRPDEYDEEITGLNPLTAAQFRACLLGQMVRRAKSDVLKELPDKTYTVLRPEIPPGWRQAYEEMREDMLAALPDGGELSVMDTLSQLTRLMQLASSAADVAYEETWSEREQAFVKKAVVTLRAPSWKAETLMGILAASSEPVAVFTASRQLARIVGESYLAPAGLRYGYVVGTGGGVTRGTRKAAVEDFQAGKLDVIVCTAGAGGLGITLTRAPTAVLLQRPFGLDKAVQPEDRIHRLGQMADKVEIIDVVAKDTVDERVRELLRVKAGRLSEFVQDPRIVRELLGGNK